MSYTKSTEVEIVRIKHNVSFHLNCTARQLKSYLHNVPDNAIVCMVVGDDDNQPEIVFEEEYAR